MSERAPKQPASIPQPAPRDEPRADRPTERGDKPAHDAPPLAPHDFYREFASRPDVAEILKQLAK